MILPNNEPSMKKYIISIITTLMVVIIAIASGGFIALSHFPWQDILTHNTLKTAAATIVLDDENNELFRFQRIKHEPLSHEQLTPIIINSFTCAEDWQFFNHHGLSWTGIARSLLVNVYHGEKIQGASTITQQLVKLVFFNQEKHYSRKIKEQWYALMIEKSCTKEQILLAYLNHVYFGCGIYGVQTACKKFWNKNIRDITIDEAALLAGIIKSPQRYCPLYRPLSAKKRRDTILMLMKNRNIITFKEYNEAITKPINIINIESRPWLLHAYETIRTTAEKIVGRTMLYDSGLTIKTTLNQAQQKYAYEQFTTHITKLRKKIHPTVDGALIAMKVTTGEIKAIIGGFNFFDSQFNRAIQAKRQLGSVFKTIVYAAAIEKGAMLSEIEIDEPISITENNANIWQPRNYNRIFCGPITLAYALARSNNIATIKTIQKTGLDYVINLAKKAHLTAPMLPYPSLALGCLDTTLMEAVGMFNIFANHGQYTEPHLISSIKDSWGKSLYKRHKKQEQIFSSITSDQVARVLRYSTDRLNKLSNNTLLSTEAISKTGTTNQARTCWFIGSTPEITVGVYIGRDDNAPMGNNIYPVHTAFPIWLAYIKKYPGLTKKFSIDPALKEITINGNSGQNTNDLLAINTITIAIPKIIT